MPTIAQMKQQVDRIWFESFHTTLADTLVVQLRQHALAGVRAALETALVEELLAYRQTCPQMAGEVPLASAFHRALTYTRRVLTSYGFIPDLRFPKLRATNRERPWRILRRYQLAMPDLLDQALYLYTVGLSIRDLQEALYVLFGHMLSRDAINRVTVAAQSPMQLWRNRPIVDTPPILIVDGVWVQVLAPTGQTFLDRSGHERREMRGQERVVLTVMGCGKIDVTKSFTTRRSRARTPKRGRPFWRRSCGVGSIPLPCGWSSVMAVVACRQRWPKNCPLPSSNAA
jgi:hypothetical protein